MRSDRHYGQFFPARIYSQSNHIKGDHQCSQPAIPDYGQFFVAKWQVHSCHCGQKYFQYIVMTILRGDFYIEKLSPLFSTHVQCVHYIYGK